MTNYEDCDAVGLAELVRRREVEPRELLAQALARLERAEPRLGPLVVHRFEVSARAAPPTAPLAGVPFLLKDLGPRFAGAPQSCGSRFFERGPAARDGELVARYRRAGLAIFGATATPELGLTTTTESARFGATRNPWRLERSAGGSSGGAAAAVCAGVVPAAHASDGGGSIRIPASSCGLFGLKPSRARTPCGPELGEGWAGMICEHAITRSVRDSAALLDAVAGPAPGDPYCAPPPARPFLDEVGAPPGRLRIGLVLESFNGAPVHPDCRAAAQDAAQLCAELGHELCAAHVAVSPEQLREVCTTLICAHVSAAVEERSRELGRAPREGELEPVTRALLALAERRSAADYVRAITDMHAIGRTLASSFGELDVLLTPAMAGPPPALGVLSLCAADGEAFRAALAQSTAFTQLYNAAGLPAMSVPLYWSAEGLPIGAQFAAPLGGEAVLLRLAAQLEQARPWLARRP